MDFQKKDIRGIYTDVGTICVDCMTSQDFENLKREEVILDEDLEDPEDRRICDECGKRL